MALMKAIGSDAEVQSRLQSDVNEGGAKLLKFLQNQENLLREAE